jgi:hypothetical protein
VGEASVMRELSLRFDGSFGPDEDKTTNTRLLILVLRCLRPFSIKDAVFSQRLLSSSFNYRLLSTSVPAHVRKSY